MDTEEIDVILRNDPYCKTIYRGVYPADMIPRNLKPPYAFVLNTDTRYGPGEHWVAVYYEKELEWFDSYGRHPGFYKINLQPTVRNTEPIQGSSSEACGLYALSFIMHRCRGFSFKTIVSRLYVPFQFIRNDCAVLYDMMMHVYDYDSCNATNPTICE